MSKRFKLSLIITMLLSIFIGVDKIQAASTATLELSGASTVNTNANITLDINVKNISGYLVGVGGTITTSDSSCLSFVSLAAADSNSMANKNIFAFSSMNGTNSNTTIAKATFKASSSACQAKIIIESPTLSFFDNDINASNVEKTITVTGATVPTKSSDATLKTLVPSTGELSPSFISTTENYELKVSDSVNTVTFTATTTDSKATIESGTTCSITTNPTACKIVVKAEDGTKKTYTVNVTKETDQTPTDPTDPEDPKDEKSGDATLKSLDVSGFTLTPTFKKDVTTYSMTVSNNITGLNVTAVPTDDKAKVEITGASGWKEGVNPIKIKVTAEDGTTKTYTVNVTRKALNSPTHNSKDPKSTDNYLKDLIVNDGELKPNFNSNTSNYSITVPNEVTNLDLEAIASSDKAKVKITGNENFKVGLNIVTIEVTAEDGSLRVYTINVTRSDKNSDNKLEDLIIKDYDPKPGFSPDIFEYIIDVPNDVDELDISAIAKNKNAKVEIIGNENLKEGSNTVLVKVTDELGFTQYYRLTVNKEGTKKFLGLTLGGWLSIIGIITLLGLLLLILLLLLKKKKKEPETTPVQTPIIEFKPEFNFGSKNGTDDDVVNEGGVLNQYSGSIPKEEKKVIAEAKVKDATPKQIPYDPYDEIVTKDELFDEIEEARETKDQSKLKMLYEQEALNRKKEKMKKSEAKHAKKED